MDLRGGYKGEKETRRQISVAVTKTLSVNDLVSVLTKLAHKEGVPPGSAIEGPGDARHSLGGLSKTQELLGYSVDASVAACLHKTVQGERLVNLRVNGCA